MLLFYHVSSQDENNRSQEHQFCVLIRIESQAQHFLRNRGDGEPRGAPGRIAQAGKTQQRSKT